MSDMEKLPDEEVMPGHEYDGIEEMDNPLPKWWLYGFYLTIIFSIFYVGYYHFGPGAAIEEVYDENVAQIQEARAEQAPKGIDGDKLVAMANDEEAVSKGHDAYQTTCAACHGAQGEGLIGPNLTDKYWVHGGTPENIFDTIVNGVPDKGMPAWGQSLSYEDIERISAYILSIQGTNPPNAKEPQGEPIDESAQPAAQ